MIKSSSLLTIQKFIYLLSDFHYHEFVRYLSSTNALLPLKLTQNIKDKLPEFDTPEELCKKVYGGADKSHRQNFNQLSSYTFKLSSVLAQNFPSYLHYNTSKLQRFVNEGKREDANLLAESMLDIAERIEDFQGQISALKFLGQQAFLVKDIPTGVRFNTALENAIENERLLFLLQSYMRKAFHVDDVINTENGLDNFKAYYQPYLNHSSAMIRIFSQYACISAIYNYNAESITLPVNVEAIKALEREMNNYDYLAFPFMTDLKGNFGFLRLNSAYIDFNSKEGQKNFDDLSRYYSSIKFWKNYLNFGQMHLIAIQVSRLMTTYHYQLHRSDYNQVITDNDSKILNSLLQESEEMLGSDISKKYYEYEMRSLRMLHGALLIFRGGDSIKKGVNEIESLLIIYQQINLKAATDSIYLCLMIGYFSMKDYEKCAQTYKRYNKIIKGKPIFEGNDSKIHAYYYVSQWLETGSKQYVAKLNTLLRDGAKHGPHSTIRELAKQFDIEVDDEPVAENRTVEVSPAKGAAKPAPAARS
ncbi:MAG: hypothetical protein JWO06_2822 [Bacteroidota bacterium]|nr:hypothetical protein [Bacteroidota bacterium]